MAADMAGETPGVDVVETDEGTMIATKPSSNRKVTTYALYILVGIACCSIMLLIFFAQGSRARRKDDADTAGLAMIPSGNIDRVAML